MHEDRFTVWSDHDERDVFVQIHGDERLTPAEAHHLAEQLMAAACELDPTLSPDPHVTPRPQEHRMTDWNPNPVDPFLAGLTPDARADVCELAKARA